MQDIYPIINIKRNKSFAVSRRHPWIFSGALNRHEPLEDGQIVRVLGSDDNYLCTGIFQNGSISVRIIDFNDSQINIEFWKKKITTALGIRKSILLPSSLTNCFRLINGEGDHMPGVIADYYNKNIVLQIHVSGILQHLDDLIQAFRESLEDIDSIIVQNKFEGTAYQIDPSVKEEFIVAENGIKFNVNPIKGQKTGFFLDQRENRKMLGELAKGKKVTNLFCYTGGFSMYALKNDAAHVSSIDVSGYAIETLESNLKLNNFDLNKHESIKANVKEYIKSIPADSQELMIVDPPAFAKSISKRHNAVKAYKRLNEQALRKMKAGSMMMTFSCSQVVDPLLFNNTIRSSAIEVGKEIKILKHLSQGPDHPTNIYHPEGKYLKGLLLYIN